MSSNSRVVCVIPARYASLRLPGKPIAVVGGLPLVMWVYNLASSAGVFDQVLVATDDDRIVAAVRDHQGKAVMTSPDHASGTDRVLEAVQGIDCTHVVNLQGDEPLLPEFVVRQVVAALPDLDTASLLTCVSNATMGDGRDPNVVKAVLAANGDALYFSRSPIPWHGEGACSRFCRHRGIYGFSREGLDRFCSLPRGRLEQIERLEQLRALEHGMRIRCLMLEYKGTAIDTPEDLVAFRKQVGGRQVCGDNPSA